MEEYLTVDELSSKIKYSKQSLYNLIYKKTFILGKHYYKPTPKKILFKWSAVQEWIEGTPDPNGGTPANKSAKASTCSQNSEGQPAQETPKSSINI